MKINDLIYNLPTDDQDTWDTICNGDVKGIFQLEYLGKHWSKELKPRSIEELSDLIAVIRPGILESKLTDENGKTKSLTQVYCDRKNKIDPISFKHPDLESILGPTQGILCIHEDTYISMSNGTEKQIKYLKQKDLINSIDQSSYLCVEDMCYDIIESPQKNGIKITLQNGFSIILTKDHKVYTDRGPIEVQNLLNSDVIQVINQQYKIQNNIRFPIYKTNTRFAYLIGQLVGDGCSGTSISSGTIKNHILLLDYLKNNFPELIFREYFNIRSWYIGVSSKELLNSKYHGNRKTKYRKFVELLGLDKTKNNKKIPNIIFQSNSNIRRAFLAGLFDSDGYAGNKNNKYAVRSFCSNNPENINGIRKLLSLDGIESYIDSLQNHIYCSNTYKFDKLIGPYLKIKKIIGKTSDNPVCGSYPKDKVKKYIQNHGYSIKKFCIENNIGESSLFSKSIFCSIRTAKKVGIDFGDISFMKVKKIEDIKDQKFYSISVKQTHNLIGNGIVISNCYQEQAMRLAQILAGFDLIQADILRKAIGTKDAKIMASLEKTFLDGCKTVGKINEELAKEIFENIKNSQRYSFNQCLSPDTVVESRRGYLTLDEVNIGDEILTPSSDYKTNVFSTVLNKIEQGKQEVYEVILESGDSILCTLNHKFLCSDKIIRRLSDIIKNNHEMTLLDENNV